MHSGSSQATASSAGLSPVPAMWAAVVCGVMLVAVSAGGASWLDSAELIAAARELGGIHPPGHPAWLSIAAFADLFPLGPYGARVVWLSAVFGAVSAWFVARLAGRAMGAFGGTKAGHWWTFGAALAFSCCGSMWLIGARAEVYTLALACNLWALDAALRAGDKCDDPRLLSPVVETAVALALGLLNHHYITVFAVPGIVVAGWPALRQFMRGGSRPFWIALAVGVFMGAGYLAPSFRALADTEMRWGNPASSAGFWDGVTAAQFQVSVTESTGNILDNLAVLLGAITAKMGKWLATLGLVGLGVAALRRDRMWWALIATLFGSIGTKALMAINTHNPDDYGYTALAAAVMAIGIAAFGGCLFAADGPLRRLSGVRRLRLSLFVLPWVLLLAILQAVQLAGDPDTNLANLRSPDLIDTQLRTQLSPGALYLSNFVFLGFNEQAWRIAEGSRPDLTATHLSFRTGDTDGGRRFNSWLAMRRPQLRSLAVAATHLGKSPVGNILPLVESHDVFAELDPDRRIPSHVFGFNGFANRLIRMSERTLDQSVSATQDRHNRAWERLYTQLARHGPLNHQSREILVWQHALHAANALQRGWVVVAEDELRRATKLAPKDRAIGNLSRRAAVLNDAIEQGDKARAHTIVARYDRMPFAALAGGDK
jgi:hypothetical protein